MDSPHVSIVVLNWNNYEDTAECLESINVLSYPHYDIVLVDNGSTDGSGQRLEEEFTDITTIHTGENLGFAGGLNIGIKYALDRDSDLIWLVNNDVVIQDDDCLGSLVETINEDEQIGMLSPLVRHYPDTDSIWFAQGEIDWTTGEGRHNIDYSGGDMGASNIIYNEYIPFCSVLIRADVFDNVGLLPEDYFFYFEDVDYSLCVRNKGYKLATDGDTDIYHKVGQSTTNLTPVKLYYLYRNTLLFSLNHKDKVDMSSVSVSIFHRVITNFISRLVDREYEEAYAILLGAIHGIQKKGGKGPYP